MDPLILMSAVALLCALPIVWWLARQSPLPRQEGTGEGLGTSPGGAPGAGRGARLARRAARADPDPALVGTAPLQHPQARPARLPDPGAGAAGALSQRAET